MKRFNKREYRKTVKNLTVGGLADALVREAELRYNAWEALKKIRKALNVTDGKSWLDDLVVQCNKCEKLFTVAESELGKLCDDCESAEKRESK